MTPEISDYITKRYDRWLDYSRYKCSLRTNLCGQEIEVLNDVLLNVLQKDECFLLRLLNRKKVQKGKELTEFDFYVIRAIELNVCSFSAPYLSKNKPIPRVDIPFDRLVSPELPKDEFDSVDYMLFRGVQLDQIISQINLTEKELAVFNFRVENNHFKGWQGEETKRQLYFIFSKVVGKIRRQAKRNTIRPVLFRRRIAQVRKISIPAI